MAEDSQVEPYLARLWATKDQGKITRTITLFWMMWLTTEVFQWVMVFAGSPGASKLEIAAIIGAVLTPLAGLHGAIFKFYTSGKKDGAQ